MNIKLVYGLLSFVIAFLLVGVIILTTNILSDGSDEDTQVTDNEVTEDVEEAEETEDAEQASTADAENNALVRNGCTACHAVSALDIDGANTGPDLSNAFSTVESKHGKPIEEYLQEPTSAVMSTVIEGNPLSDEDLEAVLNALEEADAVN